MSATRRRFLGRAAAAFMAAAVSVIASVPFLPDSWNTPVMSHGPTVLVVLLAAAAACWSAAHTRHGRPSPRPRAARAAIAIAAREPVPLPSAAARLELPAAPAVTS